MRHSPLLFLLRSFAIIGVAQNEHRLKWCKPITKFMVSVAAGGMLVNSVLADSRLNAPSAAGTRVNSDAESLLRNGLPINNKQIRNIQRLVEEMKLNIKTRRTISAQGNLADIKSALKKDSGRIVADAPELRRADLTKELKVLEDELQPVADALEQELRSGPGSVQEQAGKICLFRLPFVFLISSK